MPSHDQNLTVRHDEAAHRFEAMVDGYPSVLDYHLDENRAIFTHTFVPAELRGRGIAEKLVRAGLDWARGQGKRVVPACSYVAVFIQRHPEYQSLVE
jgi:predicted GNAT family acetyltransferase